MKRILLLGGIGEALTIARRLGPQHLYSLAGLGKVPDDLACEVRVGGYGGAEGLGVERDDQTGVHATCCSTPPIPMPRRSAPTLPAPRNWLACPVGRCVAPAGRLGQETTGVRPPTGLR